jgi:hypothetical protein
MKIRTLAIVTAMALRCTVLADEQDDKMPPAAQEIVRMMHADINIIRSNAVKKLNVELKKAMQKGSLNESIAIKRQIEKIHEEVESGSNESPDSRPLRASVAGVYTKIDDGFSLTLMPNGTFKSSHNESGTWTIEQGEVVCTYRNSKGFEKFLVSDITKNEFAVTNHPGDDARDGRTPATAWLTVG